MVSSTPCTKQRSTWWKCSLHSCWRRSTSLLRSSWRTLSFCWWHLRRRPEGRKRAFPERVVAQIGGMSCSHHGTRSSTLWYFFSKQSPFMAYGDIPALKLRVCCSRHRLHVTLFELISFQSFHTAHGQARRVWSELELSKDHTWSRIVDLLRLLVITFTCMCTSFQTNANPTRVTQVVEPTTTHATTQSFCDAIAVSPRNSRTMASAAILLRSDADASECTWTLWNWSKPHSSASIDCLSRGKRASEDVWRRPGRDAQPKHC